MSEARAALAATPEAMVDLVALTERLMREIGAPNHAGHFTRAQLEAALGRAWMMGGAVALNTLQGLRTCRICGCWELQACPGRCGWVARDLCSACVPIRPNGAPLALCGGCNRPASLPHFCEPC